MEIDTFQKQRECENADASLTKKSHYYEVISKRHLKERTLPPKSQRAV